MPSLPITLLFCVIGAIIGHLILKKDALATGLGIGLGLSPAFAIEHQAPVYMLAVVLFVPLLIWRRKHVLSSG